MVVSAVGRAEYVQIKLFIIHSLQNVTRIKDYFFFTLLVVFRVIKITLSPHFHYLLITY